MIKKLAAAAATAPLAAVAFIPVSHPHLTLAVVSGGFNWTCLAGGIAVGAGFATLDPVLAFVGGILLTAC